MDKPIYIQSMGAVYFDAVESGVQPDLKQAMTEVCTQRFRRIDRFIQLALVGAGRCAKGKLLDAQTAVYLTSGAGPTSMNIDVQQNIFRDHREPRPVSFINTLGNSAGYYVGKDLGLCGQNLFVTRDVHAFESVLEIAALDIHAGRVGQSLIGIVDEISHPLFHQCQRMHLPADTKLGEGSHWFLVSGNANDETIGVIEESRMFDSDDALITSLTSCASPTGTYRQPLLLFFGLGCDSELIKRCLATLPVGTRKVGFGQQAWNGLNAGAINGFLESDSDGKLLIISRDRESRCHATRVSSLCSISESGWRKNKLLYTIK
ncbi:MAG: hypothetical protein COC05_00725 [Gammaproteobacteria bacterium]|nr:MAG: hypothetical protein COC05_00725 [Gammaproteobacteria bacterium]